MTGAECSLALGTEFEETMVNIDDTSITSTNVRVELSYSSFLICSVWWCMAYSLSTNISAYYNSPNKKLDVP